MEVFGMSRREKGLASLLVFLMAGLPEPADGIGNMLFIGVVQVTPEYQLAGDKEVRHFTAERVGQPVQCTAGVALIVFNSADGGEVHGRVALFRQGSLAVFGRFSVGQYPIPG